MNQQINHTSYDRRIHDNKHRNQSINQSFHLSSLLSGTIPVGNSNQFNRKTAFKAGSRQMSQTIRSKKEGTTLLFRGPRNQMRYSKLQSIQLDKTGHDILLNTHQSAGVESPIVSYSQSLTPGHLRSYGTRQTFQSKSNGFQQFNMKKTMDPWQFQTQLQESSSPKSRQTYLRSLQVKTESQAIRQKMRDSNIPFVNADDSEKLQSEQIYKSMCKETKIDLRKEYVAHLKHMSHLKIFGDLKMMWDHTFFKSIISSQIDEVIEPISFDAIDTLLGGDIMQMGEEMVAKGLDSIIDQRYSSFLSQTQELSIPKSPISLVQNKKLITIWLESKDQLDQELKQQTQMTLKEAEKSTTVSKIKDYFYNTLMILERWMKTMCSQENDLVSALIVDQLIKNVLIKLDSVFDIKEQIVQNEIQECQHKIFKMKEACKHKLNEQLIGFEVACAKYDQTIAELNRKIQTQHQIIESMQVKINNEQNEVKELTSHDHKLAYLEDLQDSFREVNRMIQENENQKNHSVRLVGEYTKMIDIGVTKKPTIDIGLQTDISFLSTRPAKMLGLMDTKGTVQIYLKQFNEIESFNSTIRPSLEIKTALNFESLMRITNDILQEKMNTGFGKNSPSMQNIMFAAMIEQGQKIDNIKQLSHNFMAGLFKTYREGYVYSLTISKLFGFKQTVNTNALNQIFAKELNNFDSFYKKEKSRQNSLLSGHAEADVDEEPEIEILSLQKVISYIKATFCEVPCIGQKIIEKIIDLVVKSKNPRSLGMSYLNEIYSNDDVPWPKQKDDDDRFDDFQKHLVSQSLIQTFTKVMCSLYLQFSGKTSDLMFVCKSYDNSNSIGVTNFTDEHIYKAFKSDSKAWLTKEESKVILEFMDPLKTGKFNSKAFVELFSHVNLIGAFKEFTINTSLVLYSIYEAFEKQLHVSQKELAIALLLEHKSNKLDPSDEFKDFSYFASKMTQFINIQDPQQKVDLYWNYMIELQFKKKEMTDSETCSLLARIMISSLEDIMPILKKYSNKI